MCSSVALLLLSGVLLALAAQLPLSFPRCRRRDPALDQCLVSAIQTVMPQLASESARIAALKYHEIVDGWNLSIQTFEGIPELGFPPLEPYYVGVLDFPRTDGRNSLGLHLSDNEIYGLSRLHVDDVKADLTNSRLEILVEVNLLVEANYDLDAVIMGVPLLSQGRCNITITSSRGTVSPTGITESRGLGSYLDVDLAFLKVMSIKSLIFNFDRLHPDPERNAALNKLLNDHSQESLRAHVPAWESQFSILYGELSNRIFDNVPLEQIFLED